MLASMADHDPKADLKRYLQTAREVLVWKLEGLSEYDIRRPLTPTGTNLLGLVKHVAMVEAGYFGDCMGFSFPEKFPSYEEEAEPNADMWATPEETREQIVDLYRRVWAHSDATIDRLPLDAPAHVPWWPPERADTTLHMLLVRMLAEAHRHAGHADIVRELIDGGIGHREGVDNLPEVDAEWWAGYRERIEAAAKQAEG